MPHPTRRTDRRALRPILLVAIGALVLVVLRSPTGVLSVFAPPVLDGPTPGPVAPDGTAVASVRVRDAGGVAPSEEVDAVVRASQAAAPGAAPGTDQGRFDAPASRPSSALLLEELRGGWRVESGVEEATGLAVVAAHTWAATRGIVPAGSRGPGGAIVTVEAVERPGAHHAVITLLVAAPTAGAYDLHRIAVPVLLGADGPELAGAPWVLPAPSLRTSPLVGDAIGDPELIAEARRALEGIGLRGERLVALEATDGWPFIARLDDEADGHPWLRWHVDRFVVAGLPLDAARE